MKAEDIPFIKFNDNDIARPWLPVTIYNPHTKLSVKVYGLIDTGADECAIPAEYAPNITKYSYFLTIFEWLGEKDDSLRS